VSLFAFATQRLTKSDLLTCSVIRIIRIIGITRGFGAGAVSQPKARAFIFSGSNQEIVRKLYSVSGMFFRETFEQSTIRNRHFKFI
jgi:hypothetical protein